MDIDTFRTFSLILVLIAVLRLVKSFKKLKGKEENALPWYKKDAFWDLAVLLVYLYFAIGVWNLKK